MFAGRLALFSGVSYDTDAIALFARMAVQPSPKRKRDISMLIKALKDDGIWSRMTVLYVMAAHDEQASRLNWVSTSFTLTAVNTPTFTTDRGWQGNASTSYLGSGYIPSTMGGQLNDQSLVGWMQQASTNGAYDYGANSARLRLASRSTVNNWAGNVNSATGLAIARVGAATGMFGLSRSDSANLNYFDNGTYGTIASVSDSQSVSEVTVCRGTTFSDGRVAMVGSGLGLTQTQLNTLYSAMTAYMQSVGAA